MNLEEARKIADAMAQYAPIASNIQALRNVTSDSMVCHDQYVEIFGAYVRKEEWDHFIIDEQLYQQSRGDQILSDAGITKS